jgi:hypothetical protein
MQSGVLSNAGSSRPGGTAISIRAAGDVREEVGTPSFTRASLFVALVLLYFQPITASIIFKKSAATPFREPLQFIVIAVMSGTFPDTYGVFYMTVYRWRVRGPSRHRHGYRHRGKGLGKPLSRCHDGDDAHDAQLRRFSRRSWRCLPSQRNLPNVSVQSLQRHLSYLFVGR